MRGQSQSWHTAIGLKASSLFAPSDNVAVRERETDLENAYWRLRN
jgi:hypothetical protein